MGKTGSTAIARAVSAVTGEYVFQVFRLNAGGLAGAEHRYREQLRKRMRSENVPQTSPFPGAMHLWESDFLVDHPPTPRVRWDVITSVREPVGQAVSAFFHARAREGSGREEPNLASLREQLVADDWLSRPMRWFEREFVPSVGIDVFSEPFDPSVGVSTIEAGCVRVLLLRQESLERAPAALRDFLGLGAPVDIPRRNEAKARDDANAYREFVEHADLPAAIVDASYASTFSRHFYSDAELAKLRSRWTHEPVTS